MKLKLSLSEIKKELHHLRKYDVVVFGSYSSGDFTERSDIDIAIITHETSPDKNIEIWKKILSKAKRKYHFNIFELLPLHLKAGIMDEFKVVFGDTCEITEYFYHFRKLWNDSKHRYYDNQFSSFKEKMELMEGSV